MKEITRTNLLKFAEQLVDDIKKCDQGEASIEAGTAELINELTGFVEHACNGERTYKFKTYTAIKDKRAELFARCEKFKKETASYFKREQKKDEFYPTDEEIKKSTEKNEK